MGNKSSLEKPLVIKMQKNPLLQRIIARPFKYYFRMGGITFGFTLFGNLITTIFDKDRRTAIKKSPDLYTTGVLTKSLYFGLLWPSFYFKLFTRPREVMYFGAGMEKVIESDYIKKATESDRKSRGLYKEDE